MQIHEVSKARERAHKRAENKLVDFLEEFLMEEVDVQAIERYRVDFLVSILKAHGDDDPSILLPALLNECRVENVQKHIEKSLSCI